MGYSSSVTGEIYVSPVPAPNLLDLVALRKDRNVSRALECLKVEFEFDTTTEIETDGTEVTRRKVTAAKLMTRCEGVEHSHYYLQEGLQALVNSLGKNRKYSGWFDFRGEAGDLMRYAIVDGVAREFEPTITWPAEVN